MPARQQPSHEGTNPPTQDAQSYAMSGPPPDGNYASELNRQTADKENDNTGRVTNRRESLGKGILKPMTKKDENHTIQLPLRDSQQLSNRLSLDSKTYRRRVSFAPEVTLHKIELVPQSASPEQRVPARRQTIAFTPQTPKQLSPLRSESSDRVFQPEHNMYDSSDVEMEDATNVFSSPHKAGPPFKIHSDNFEDEYTGTVDMSMTKYGTGVDQDEEDTMDLTKPLGNIQLVQSSLPVETNPLPGTQGSLQMSLESEQSQGSQRLFGSIKSLFGEEEEEEEAMEEQQPPEPEKTGDNDEDVEMELTEQISLPITVTPRPEPRPEPSEEAEETMELTTLADASMDRVTLQNTLLNRDLQATPERDETMTMTMMMDHTVHHDHNQTMDQSMDQTRAVGSILSNLNANINPSQTDEEGYETAQDMTVDETRLPTTIQVRATQTTPLKANRSHTSETGSPMSSKRKKRMESEEITSELRARINLLTPKKKRRTMSVDDLQATQSAENTVSLVPFEPVESILSTQIPSSLELKSSFTPLRSSNDRKSVTGGKVEFALTQKIPLAPSHEQEEGAEDDEYTPVSLSQFLDDASIVFYDKLETCQDFTVDFKTSDPHPPAPTTLDFAIAKNTKIPWLELLTFSCDELRKNVEELKSLFDNFDSEFSEENPRLVREYYESRNLGYQLQLGSHMILMKQYADYTAQQSWCLWREKLLDELHIRMEKNLYTLVEDEKVLESCLTRATEMESSLVDENAKLDAELEALLQEKASVDSPDADRLIELRGELLSKLQELEKEEQECESLVKKVEELFVNVTNTSALENELEELDFYVKRHSQDPQVRLSRDLELFENMQRLSGVKLVHLKGSTIVLSLMDSDIKLTMDLLNREKCPEVWLPEKMSLVEQVFLNKYITANKDMETRQFIKGLEKLSLSLRKFESDLFSVGLLCPSQVTVSHGVTVSLIQFDKEKKYKAKVEIVFDEHSMLNGCSPQRVEAKLVYGNKRINNETVLQGLKDKMTSGSFIQSIRTLQLTR